jgi:SAM-dependent methyltransferase
MDKEFWNSRYTSTENSYGGKPNEFFRQQMESLAPGILLLPGEGEGRNALYAASQGWQVQAYDFSEVARAKTLDQARQLGITGIQYGVQDLGGLELNESVFDAVALIYVHLPEPSRKHLHAECVKSLKPGGRLILECFTKDQVRYDSGGPKISTLLYSEAELALDFSPLKIEFLREEVVSLDEGPFHQGPASVVRLVGVKI